MALRRLKMKKIYSIAAIMLIICMLCACGTTAKVPDMQTVADAVGAAMDISEMSQTPDAYVENVMSISSDSYSIRNTLISHVGTNINEYGIFLATDEDNAKAINEALEAYLDYRESLWMDEYLPDEKPKLDNAEVWQQGNFVMYVILGDEDRAAVKSAFDSCFEG
jgi:hypothetical protein